MIVEQSKQIIEEVGKAFIGKTDLVEKVLMTIYAGGHVLLEDCPGVGKTTLAIHAIAEAQKAGGIAAFIDGCLFIREECGG